MTTVRKRLAELRQLMQKNGLAAYLVPSTDPHGSEYVPECWQRRKWLSGFTGSAGDLVVASDAAALWTDGRYHLQAAAELKGSGIKLMKQGVKGTPAVAEWLTARLTVGETAGVDPQLLTPQLEHELRGALEAVAIKLRLLEGNLVDRIWSDRPPLSPAPIELLPAELAGEPARSKLKRLRAELARVDAQLHVLTALDAIAWLYNIRGADVAHNPVVICYALVGEQEAALYVEEAKVTPEVRRALRRAGVALRPYAAFGADLAESAHIGLRTWVDSRSASSWVLRKLRGGGPSRRRPRVEPSPIWRMKAAKNETELAGARAAHRRDGRAMVRFLAWLERAVRAGGVTEVSAGEKLGALRAEEERYRGESFPAIVGYGAHGAIIHYQASPESDVALAPEGLLLVDSGGQYLDGTTDITRTILLGGTPSAEQRDRFTRVLKGHIAIARCRFPAGTAGRQIDAFARRALWDVGLNYAHGTGHGVGAYLSVHEGPQAISPTRCVGVPLEEGNIQSDEPGFYKEGEYGIRIENLLLAVRDRELWRHEAPFLCFEPLTLCPIDTRLVEPSLLDADERAWLDGYHTCVRETLAPTLDAEEAAWLAAATRPLCK